MINKGKPLQPHERVGTGEYVTKGGWTDEGKVVVACCGEKEDIALPR